MSIHIHKTGANKTLGQQSDAIFSTNLIGHWEPDQNWLLPPNIVWGNKVAGQNDLRRFNSISRGGSGTGTHVAFDGTDDYIGETSTGYGGDPFTLNVHNAWTVGVWVYLGAIGSSTPFQGSPIFGLGNYAYCRILDNTNHGSNNRKVRSHFFGNTTHGTSQTVLTESKWYYVTVTHDGAASSPYTYKTYINGRFEVSHTSSSRNATATQNFKVGWANDGSARYGDSTMRIGRVHVYDAELKNSQIRQNFLASHDMHDTRIYDLG